MRGYINKTIKFMIQEIWFLTFMHAVASGGEAHAMTIFMSTQIPSNHGNIGTFVIWARNFYSCFCVIMCYLPEN